ncbi:hypothetical protein ACI4AF_28970, partial [Klebsiella pneumoniae]|uniref:hypothetical protein n=1 Tax=Klebsiella pneumoniae TaxID=573 RepID=UPI0038550B85
REYWGYKSTGVDPSGMFIMREAYANGLLKSEIERLEKVRDYVPPLRRTVEERIAEARRMAEPRTAVCRFAPVLGRWLP